MKLKKIILSLGLIIAFILTTAMQNKVYAEVSQEPIYLGITELMMDEQPYMGYAIGKPGDENASKIWNIVRYSTEISEDPTEANIYCIKAGVGFSDVSRRATYNVFYDMKTQRDLIAKQNETLKELVEGKIDLGDGKSISRYNAILAVIDMMYLPGESDIEEKTEILNNIVEFAKDPSSGYTDYVGLIQQYPLTDNDISAIQQAALWYFTNYEEPDKYDKTDDKSWLNYTLTGKDDYEPLANYTPNHLQPQYDAGQARTYQAEILYNYIIKEAKENADKYENIANEVPAKVNTTSLKYELNENNYIVGPINISKNENSATPYSIDFIVKNEEQEIKDYKLLNANKEEVAEGTTVKDLVGQEFYISLSKENVTNLSININIKYNNTKMT